MKTDPLFLFFVRQKKEYVELLKNDQDYYSILSIHLTNASCFFRCFMDIVFLYGNLIREKQLSACLISFFNTLQSKHWCLIIANIEIAKIQILVYKHIPKVHPTIKDTCLHSGQSPYLQFWKKVAWANNFYFEKNLSSIRHSTEHNKHMILRIH